MVGAFALAAPGVLQNPAPGTSARDPIRHPAVRTPVIVALYGRHSGITISADGPPLAYLGSGWYRPMG